LKINTNTNKGFTLVEALVGMGIIAVVMVGILSTFSQQQMASRKNSEKNTAVILAEMKMEELMKFSAVRLKEWLDEDDSRKNVVDYIIHKDNKFKSFDADPNEPKQYRRTTRVWIDFVTDIANIHITVEYGRTKLGLDKLVYPFQINLSTRRGA
jgi:prepilin-type N-terminal cleavage/methylation domain-containing protein